MTTSQLIKDIQSRICVLLDKEDCKYTAGEVIKGAVVINFPQEITVKEVRLNIHGASRVSWNEQRAYTKGSSSVISHKNSEVFLDHNINLLKKVKEKKNSTSNLEAPTQRARKSSICQALTGEEEGTVLNPGTNRYQFEIPLPKGLPGSYEGKWGGITYALKVILHRPWKFDVEKVEPLYIRGCVDFNDDPEIVRPIAGSGDFAVGGLCCSAGIVVIDVRVGRKGFVLGEKMPFFVEITNSSSRKMSNSYVALIQHVIFKTGKKMKKLTNIVAKIPKGEIPSGGKKLWDKEVLEFPDDLPPTTITKAVQIKYTMTVVISPPGWGADDFSIPVNISIGTIGLTKATIDKYINQLKLASSDLLETNRVKEKKSSCGHKKVRSSLEEEMNTKENNKKSPRSLDTEEKESIKNLKSILKKGDSKPG